MDSTSSTSGISPTTASTGSSVAAAPQAAPAMNYSAPQPVTYNSGAAPMPMTPPAPSPFDFLKGINWLELGVLLVGTFALLKTAQFYNYKLKEEKTTYYDMRKDHDKLNQRITMAESDISGIINQMSGGSSSGNVLM